jgi:hypothetical protein
MATAAQIQAEIAAGPQTQDALDAILVKYSPAELAAALPQYGSVDDYATARAAAEQREFIAWQAEQPNPLGQGTLADVFASQGITDPKNDPRLLAQAQEQINRASRREDMYAQAGVAPGDFRPWSDAPVPTGGTVAGGGTAPRATGLGNAPASGGLLGTTTTGTGGPAAPAVTPAQSRIQGIQQWYNSNVGRTDSEAQRDLNRFLATSGYTAREINAAVPNWGLNDLQNAMRTAIAEVAQQTPFAPVAAQPMQPLAQPYTSIASQLPGGADARAQEIRNWYAANEGRTDPQAQADLQRFLASGYSAQEINRALPQFDVPFLSSGISAAQQALPQAALESNLARYQSIAPGAQYAGAASPYGLIMDQMQPSTNPYAESLANTALGGYNPGVYNVLLDEKIDPVTGIAVPVNDGGAGGDAGASTGSGATGTGQGTGMSNQGEGGPDSGNNAGWAKGGLIDRVSGPNPPGPDDGAGMLDLGEYVIKKSSVKKYGAGLLDMINEGKIPAKKMKSLLG